MRTTLNFAPGMLLMVCGAALGAQSAVTIHNDNFAVVRESISLDLNEGINTVAFTDVAAHIEPDSVILRDARGTRVLQVLEQNYRNDPISQELLLSLYEGKEIEFIAGFDPETREPTIIRGKIIRSGYVPHREAGGRYGREYSQRQMALSYHDSGTSQPIIEVGGQLRFSLPGQPIFPALADETILKPTLNWLIRTDSPGPVEAELAYVTGGMSWQADYNIVAPENGDRIDLVGWVTIDNQSGKTFENARLKLMAGDTNKLHPSSQPVGFGGGRGRAMDEMLGIPVSEKSFDEYHLYTINRESTLRDRETKQIEFIRAADIKATKLYVYEGAYIDPQRYAGWTYESIRQEKHYGAESNPKVWVMREFENSAANGLGAPLPKGRLRFYQADTDGQLEFLGENLIDHTPVDEKVRVYTGNAFDIVGERMQTDYRANWDDDWIDESFKITLRNRKKEAVEVVVVERMYRWTNWDVREKSQDFTKTDAQTIEFRVKLEPGEEKTVTYQVHYSW